MTSPRVLALTMRLLFSGTDSVVTLWRRVVLARAESLVVAALLGANLAQVVSPLLGVGSVDRVG